MRLLATKYFNRLRLWFFFRLAMWTADRQRLGDKTLLSFTRCMFCGHRLEFMEWEDEEGYNDGVTCKDHIYKRYCVGCKRFSGSNDMPFYGDQCPHCGMLQ